MNNEHPYLNRLPPSIWNPPPNQEQIRRWSIAITVVLGTSYVGGGVVLMLWVVALVAWAIVRERDQELVRQPAPATTEQRIINQYLRDDSPEAHDRLERSLDQLYGLAPRSPEPPGTLHWKDANKVGMIKLHDGTWMEVRDD